MTFTVFMLLRASRRWLALDRSQRDSIAAQVLQDTFGPTGPRLRFFDSEAFSARVSDIAMIEADSPEAHYFAIERLRDSPLIADGHFEVVEILPAFENGHRVFAEQVQADDS